LAGDGGREETGEVEPKAREVPRNGSDTLSNQRARGPCQPRYSRGLLDPKSVRTDLDDREHEEDEDEENIPGVFSRKLRAELPCVGEAIRNGGDEVPICSEGDGGC
jgi:hypothetical protein